MTYSQEEALYEFLDSTIQPFKVEEAVAYIRMIDSKRVHQLAEDIVVFLDSRHIAFRKDNGAWMSRRGFFEQAPFVISPTKLELRNGILIPGHRCVPFASQELLPQEFVFYWKNRIVPTTTTEGDPKEFYLYYTIFGEEYAPQYVARDNPENEKAYNNDMDEDPAEVSINTLDMRNIYRETSFVPGDRFVVRTLDWRKGTFSLERVGKDEWAEEDLNSWAEAAEAGFENSFNILGPGSSTEEQIAYAYWYGNSRMREVPAYALEEFFYEKTDRIETVSYGIETRFWFAGKEIPDLKKLDGSQTRPDKTTIEKLLCEKGIPVSEYVIHSYIRDSLYRMEEDDGFLIKRIVPQNVKINAHELRLLEEYISDAREDCKTSYSLFVDKSMGPIRQRVGELHTAVIDMASRLAGDDTDLSWLPKHTFIVLSQIQSHAAGVMEDLDTNEPLPEEELEAMDNSLDSMIETYEDIRELIDDSLENSRRNKFSLVRQGSSRAEGERLLQFSVGGTEVWRRVIVNENCRLEELHRIIQAVFGWNNSQFHQFRAEKVLDPGLTVKELGEAGIMELLYEYGTKWTVKIMLLSRYETEEQKPARCVAGAGAAPPEFVGGPLRFRRFISALEGGTDAERQGAKEELGRDFDPRDFNLEACNKNLSSGLTIKGWRLDQ